MTWFRLCLITTWLTTPPAAAGLPDDKPDSQPTAPQAVAQPDRAALEKQLAEKLSASTLVGAFTVDGKNDGKPPRSERYEIVKVSKLRDDYWVFNARIRYGNVDVTVPITLKVFWAGDTPVVSLTNLTIPGMGTFTARVMFYGDRYVGTWQHGKVGGHMFGKIEKTKPDKADPAKDQSPKQRQ